MKSKPQRCTATKQCAPKERRPHFSHAGSTTWRVGLLSFLITFSLLLPIKLSAQTHVYDSIGRLRWSTQPNGASTSFSYDAANNLLSVTNVSASADSDADGMPDSFEIQWTGGVSTTALAPGDDPEKDSIINLAEFAFARGVTVGDIQALTPVSIEPPSGANRYLTLRYTRPKNGTLFLNYITETRAELVSGAWSSAAADVEQVSVVDQGGGIELVTVRALATVSSGTKRFLRVRINKLP
jgi:YD repeat-containing protein